MADRSMSMHAMLPCGVPFDASKGECCVTNCKESFVKAEKNPKLRNAAVDSCRYWAAGEDKTTGAAKKTASSKSRRK